MANKVKRFENVARLGRHVNHDPRSRQFAFDGSNVSLKTAKHQRYIPVLDQGDLGSCTGNAATGWLGTSVGWASIAALTPILSTTDVVQDEKFAVQLYSDATKADPYPGDYPPEDTGSDGLSVAKVLKARGLISGYTHTFSLDDALSALSTQPVIIGINWYESMFDPASNGLVTISPRSPVAGGHEVVLENKPAPTPTPAPPAPVDNAIANYPSADVDPWMNSPHLWHRATVASKALKAWKAKYGIA
jgi:hypothetical protein